jgi:(p)ppGpp synthase/HD superfamily hydrolase
MQEKGSQHAIISMSLTVKNRIHLAQIIKRIRILTGVEKVTRMGLGRSTKSSPSG